MEQRKTIPIGIDLGTAYTRAAVYDGTRWEMIPDDCGESAMPSYVAFTDSGVLVGQAARKQAPQNPSNTIFDVIRLIGRDYSDLSVQNDRRFWPFKVIDGPNNRLHVEVHWKGKLWQFTPVEICSMILMQIKKNADRTLRVTITDAVVTVPVHFSYKQRQAIKDAGMIAGLNFMQIISSPAASALFYGMDRMSKSANMKANIARSVFISEPEEYNMIIFDLGAGTLDVAVVTIKGDVCKVRATAGDVHLGGTDFDNNLVDYFIDSLNQRQSEDVSCIPMGISNLKTICEEAKISLFSDNIMVMTLKMAPLYNDVNFESSITEAKFLDLNNKLLLKCIRIMETCFRDAKISTDALHEVILAGCSTRIPLLQYRIQSCFEDRVLTVSPNLEAATASGAACQAFFLNRGQNWRGNRLSLVDAIPLSLKVWSSQGPIFVYVPRNTNIPFKIEKAFLFDRRHYHLEVYEGEGFLIHEKDLLGKVELSTPHEESADWCNINICFEMHENGTLKLVADDISSGTRKTITITKTNIEGSQKQVREALLYMESEKSTIKASSTKGLSRDSPRNLEHAREISRQYVEPDEYAIGIDFGTTYSSMAVWQQNGVKIFENEHGNRLTFSTVAFSESGRLIGDTIQLTTNPTDTVFNIKRLIGRCYSDQLVQHEIKYVPIRVICGEKDRPLVSVHYKNEEKLFAPEEIAAMILSKMKEIAEAHLNSKVSKAVISVPSSFNDSQRKAIKDAGVIAGFDVLQLLNQTTAAAIGYFLQKVCGQSFSKKKLLIFDLGGGNLDVSVVMIKEGTIRVQAVAGDTELGGEDFDNNMVSYFVEKFMKEKRRDIHNKPRSLRRVKAACEKAKRVLSNNVKTIVEIDALDEGIDFRSVITRKEFEVMNESLFKRSISCVERCLEDAMMDKSNIDEVVLVGGSTKIPKIKQLLQEFFNGKVLLNSINADEAVVYGAAVQAAILSGNEDRKKFNILELQDVTSSSFELETKDGPAMILLIPKYSAIPVKKELIYTTCLDNQSSLLIQVQECELSSTIVFGVSGITPKPRGNSKINLSFEVDNSGILNLTATDISSRADYDIVISKENGGLTTEEILKMVEAEACYKADDEEHEMRVSALNSLENFAYKMKEIASDPGVSATSKKSIETAADDVIAFLETNYDAAIDEINAWKVKLETIRNKIVYLGTNSDS